MVGTDTPPDFARIDGWKAIARYLRRDRATVMRWEAQRGLPVHRLPGGGRASVFAFESELDWWLSDPKPDASSQKSFRAAGGRGASRRHVVFGLVAATSAAAGVGWLVNIRKERTSEVSSLLEHARLLFSQNTRDTQNQAIGLAAQAVRLAPANASARGALGYLRAATSRWRPENESNELREMAIIDGQHALDLEPGNAKGELALAAALPLLGADNWMVRANGLKRSLASDPRDFDALMEKAWILRFTGQSEEASAICKRVDAKYRTAPLYNVWARSLWSSGRQDECRHILTQAKSLFPSNKMLWHTRMEIAVFSGALEEVAIIARDVPSRPSVVTKQDTALLVRMARVIESGGTNESGEIFRMLRMQAPHNLRTALNATRLASATGRLDQAFALAYAYLFSRGFAVSGNLGSGLYVPQTQRHTNFLFEPPLEPLRQDRRFGELTEELGLARYWRVAGDPGNFLQ